MFQDSGDGSIKIVVAWIGVIGAVLTALVALFNSIFTQRMSRRNQRDLEVHQRELKQTEAILAQRIESFKATLDEQRAEKDARRDYEYEARKRLYQQCEPLLFELYELSIGGMKRVGSLARTARKGNLKSNSKGWLSVDAYYTLSTVYKLMAPLVVVKIIQRRLTLIDLTLDTRIKEQYSLANCLYLTFSADFRLAKANPRLNYDPNFEFDPSCADFTVRLEKEPEKYCRQGLSVGRLDNAVEALIIPDGKDSVRCMSFGEFEAMYEDKSSNLHKRFSEVISIFLNFHPQAKPILWRILITQLHLYKTIILNSETNFRWDEEGRGYALIGEKERKRYDWRQCKEEADDQKVLVEPFEIAQQYLQKRLGHFISIE